MSGLDVGNAPPRAIKSEAHIAANVKAEDANSILDTLRGLIHANKDKDNAVLLTAAAAAAAQAAALMATAAALISK